jgi:hypothetical protein
MVGWGTPTAKPDPRDRLLAELRVAARAVVDAVGAFLDNGTTGNLERLREAHAAYRAAASEAASRGRHGW